MSNRRLVFSAALAALAAAPLLPQTALTLTDGQARLDWISPSSFRFCRAWGEEKCAPRPVVTGDEVSPDKTETASQIHLTTRYINVEIDKQNGRLRVLAGDGEELMADASPAQRDGTEISIERGVSPDEQFYGLGARTDSRASARGLVIATARPFLISSRGYGLYHASPLDHTFDLAGTNPDRYRIVFRPAARLEYYFYYGPTPKAVLEEHMRVVPPRGVQEFGILSLSDLPRSAVILPATDLPSTARALVHASLSAILNPTFDLAPYRQAPRALFQRAMQLAAVSPLIVDSASGPLDEEKRKIQENLMRWRRRMIPFLLAYVEETGTRGLPIIHPLAMQYPKDKEAGAITDEFMLGDEIVAAPILSESNRRSIYLPMGNWTDLATNRVYPGRQRIEFEAQPDQMPLFARNGSILPMMGDTETGPMILHYLPKLAAEFFLYEPDVPDYTQLHASPALDLIRLDIDSKKTRDFEWVLHHMPAPKGVETGGKPYQQVRDRKLLRPGVWFYDRNQQNLHIQVQAPAGQTQTTHIAF